jgi:hypothetical protein
MRINKYNTPLLQSKRKNNHIIISIDAEKIFDKKSKSLS